MWLNNAYSLWRVNGWPQGFRSLTSFGFGGQESSSKPPNNNMQNPVSIKMKILLHILLFSSGNLFSQMTNYVPYKCADKWGYSNRVGFELIESQYDTASLFNKGFAVVGLNNKFGLIDTNGAIILPLIFDEVNTYNEENEFIRARIRNKWRYYDIKGKRIKINVIKSTVLYDCVSIDLSKGGLAHVYLHKSDGGYGFIKYLCNNIEADSCKIFKDPKYSSYIEIGSYHLALESESGWNIFNYEGQLIHGYNISSIEKEPIGRRGNQFYRFEIDSKVGLISTNGEIVVEPKYDSIHEQTEGFYLKSKEWYWSDEQLFIVTISGDYFYIDEHGFEYICE